MKPNMLTEKERIMMCIFTEFLNKKCVLGTNVRILKGDFMKYFKGWLGGKYDCVNLSNCTGFYADYVKDYDVNNINTTWISKYPIENVRAILTELSVSRSNELSPLFFGYAEDTMDYMRGERGFMEIVAGDNLHVALPIGNGANKEIDVPALAPKNGHSYYGIQIKEIMEFKFKSGAIDCYSSVGDITEYYNGRTPRRKFELNKDKKFRQMMAGFKLGPDGQPVKNAEYQGLFEGTNIFVDMVTYGRGHTYQVMDPEFAEKLNGIMARNATANSLAISTVPAPRAITPVVAPLPIAPAPITSAIIPDDEPTPEVPQSSNTRVLTEDEYAQSVYARVSSTPAPLTRKQIRDLEKKSLIKIIDSSHWNIGINIPKSGIHKDSTANVYFVMPREDTGDDEEPDEEYGLITTHPAEFIISDEIIELNRQIDDSYFANSIYCRS